MAQLNDDSEGGFFFSGLKTRPAKQRVSRHSVAGASAPHVVQESMVSAGEMVIDVLILMAVSSYTLVALCHAIPMWSMRKQFFIALR